MARSSDHPIMKLLIATQHRLPLYVAPEWFAERLRAEFPQFDVVRITNNELLNTEIADTDVLFSQVLNLEHVLAARKLQWIHSPSAAVHQFMFTELIQSEVVLTNGREVHSPVVAEHVMALIFALARRIPESTRLQQKHVWGQEMFWEQNQ